MTPRPVHRIGGYAAFPPPADMRRLVDAAWVHVAAGGPRSGVFAATVVVPDPGTSLCLSCRRDGDGRVRHGRLSVIGPVRTARRYAPPPGARLEGIRVPAEWSRALLGTRPADVADAMVDFGAVDPVAGGRLLASLAQTRSGREAIAVLLAFVRRRANRRDPDGAAILAHRALRKIRATRAPAELRPVAEELGVSDRHLRRVVGEVTGLTPRGHARAARFLAVVRDADAIERPRWAELAAAHGFADQAHLSREARALAGLSLRSLHRTRRAETATTGDGSVPRPA